MQVTCRCPALQIPPTDDPPTVQMLSFTLLVGVSHAFTLSSAALPAGSRAAVARTAAASGPTMAEGATKTDEAFGASHTSFYTDAVAKDSYETLDEVLEAKMANTDLRSVLKTMFNACGTITEALRVELVTVAEKQASVFGDVQLGVDVVADDLMWDVCKTEPLIKEGASEEEPEVREMHAGGKYCVCWT